MQEQERDLTYHCSIVVNPECMPSSWQSGGGGVVLILHGKTLIIHMSTGVHFDEER